MRTSTSKANSVILDTALGCRLGLQVGVDEGVEVAVEDAVHVSRLLAGAVVLDQLVGVEDVGSDLGSPLYICLLATLRGDLALPLLALELEEASPQDAHRDLAVLVLAALVLALHHDARRQVRDPDRRVGLVDVLTTRSGGPVGVDLQVLLVDLDVYLIVYDRGDGDRGEARVPPRRGVERADPHQAVYPPLRREQPEGVLPRDGEGRALYAGLVAFGVLDDLEPEAPTLGPAPVHPREHLGPVLRVDATCPGVYREDGVALVVLSRQEPRDLL